MGFATINNSKSGSTNSLFAYNEDIGVTIEKMQKKKKTKYQNFGVDGFCQMTAVQ